MNETLVSIFASAGLESHPNMHKFEGLLCPLGVPSCKVPSGGRGHKIIISRGAAIDALPSLLGMAVSFNSAYDGHNHRSKCGVITDAWIEDDSLRIAGFIYRKDFPDVVAACRAQEMGMSYEIDSAHVSDIREEAWTINKLTFTGAAFLNRKKAAYKTTWLKLEEDTA